MLPAPLRDRFGFTAHVDFYERRRARADRAPLGRPCSASTSTPRGAAEIAGRSRGTPRIANRLLRRVRDYAQVHGDGRVDLATARAALALYEVDERGLDRLDRAVLHALVARFGGGPVGLSTLAVAVGEERETVETVAEPFLVREGLLARTSRGRVATPAAWDHLGFDASALSRSDAPETPGQPSSSPSTDLSWILRSRPRPGAAGDIRPCTGSRINVAPANQSRPGRSLLVITLLTLALYGYIFWPFADHAHDAEARPRPARRHERHAGAEGDCGHG